MAFGSTIATVVSNTTVTTAAAPSTAVTQGQTVYGHDDTGARQACFNYSSTNGVPCVLNSAVGFNVPAGYLVAAEGLTIPTHANITGSTFQQGTTIFAEYNGDLLSLPTGGTLATGQPVQGVDVSNLEIFFDPSQPNGRGIHLNAATGQYPFGGMYNSTFTNVEVENAAQECLWMDGGGGADYHFNLPNQYITFSQFNCNGPNQPHPANLIRVTGQNAQILFLNGATNGIASAPANAAQGSLWGSYYPNPLIAVTPKTSGLNDAPVDIKFLGYTYEGGTQGLAVSQASNIHFENGYVENVLSPLYVVNSVGITYNGNHIANSGTRTAVAQYMGNATGSFRDNFVSYDPSHVPAGLAACKYSNAVDFAENTSGVTTTSGCATIQSNVSTKLALTGTTEYLNGSSTAISNISDPSVMPGKTLTLYAAGTLKFTAGGNINFGGLTAPLTVAAGGSVTLTLLDLGPSWLVTSTTGTSPKGRTSLATNSIAPGTCQSVTAGSVNSSAALGATAASKILWTPAASLQRISGYQVSSKSALSIAAYPTPGYVNFDVCNRTAGFITPGALTLNWEVLP